MEFAAIGITAFVSGAILWGQHYTPWERWLGRRLPRVAAYTMGVLGIILPFSALMIFWALRSPQGAAAYLLSLGALWAIVLASGVTVGGLYLVDHAHEAGERATVAEKSAEVWRESTQS